jgi:Right handed beta helix region
MRRLSLLPFLIVLAVLSQVSGCGLTCNVPPSISGQPSGQSVALGQPALFTVAAAGSSPLTYQWLRSGQPIPGANQGSYVTPPTTSEDSGTAFTVIVTNRFGKITSSAATLTVSASTGSNIRFVAPNGNDSNDGSISAPYRTIQHCATTVAAGWTCAIRAGTYRETITPNSGVTISAYNLEPVVVDGSDPVTGWSLYQGSIYKVQITLGAGDTNQIFVGNNMMTEARWPNGDDLFHVNWATAQAGTDAYQIVDSNLPPLNWAGAKIHLWSGTDPFGHETGVVTASGTGQLSINVGQTGTCPYLCPANGGFYYLFGTLAALDAEREWFYDSNSATLYFMAPSRVDPNTLGVTAKQRQFAFDLRGKSGVTIQNISIFASTIVTDTTSSSNTLDRINARYVSQFTSLPPASNDASGAAFSILMVHEGDSGIIINGTGNTLQNSTISYSAGAGVAVEGSNNTIKNNLIENIDYVGDYGSGVDLDGNGNVIQNNTIQSTGRMGIYITAVLNQNIGYNNIFDSMMLSRDGGEIYTCCDEVASGTEIHHNWIHDTTIVVAGAGDQFPMAGVDIDNGSGGFNVDQNVLWNNQRDNIVINGESNSGPNTNYIHNNSVPDSSADGHVTIFNVSDCTSTRIVDNRVVVSVDASVNDSGCVLSNNSSSAAGANEMTPTSQVGCNFVGCSSEPPPAILDGGSVTPCSDSGSAQTAGEQARVHSHPSHQDATHCRAGLFFMTGSQKDRQVAKYQ